MEQYIILIELGEEDKENIFKIAFLIRIAFTQEYSNYLQANGIQNIKALINLEKFTKIGNNCYFSAEDSRQLWENLNKRVKLTGVLFAIILNEIYEKINKNIKDAISELEEKLSLVNCFDRLNVENTEDTKMIQLLFKECYPNIDNTTIKIVMLPLNAYKNITVNIIQNYLIEYSKLQLPSVKLELNFIFESGKKNIQDVFKEKNIPLEGEITKENYEGVIINKLEMNIKVGECIYKELELKNALTIEGLIEYLSQYIKQDHRVNKIEANPKSIIEELESSKVPLIELLNLLVFNDKSNTLCFLIYRVIVNYFIYFRIK